MSNRKFTRAETLDQAIEAFGGEKAFCRAFNLARKHNGQDDNLETWRSVGVPPRHYFALAVGLQLFGCIPSPRLFGLQSWQQLLNL